LDTERAYWLAWSRIEGVGAVLLKRIFLAFGSLRSAWEAPIKALLAIDGIGLLMADQIGTIRARLSPQALLAELEAQNQSFWTPADADYPRLLFEIPDPPPVLFYRGPLRLNARMVPMVAMVGTRYPTPYGISWTRRFSHCLSAQGMPIISGMAKGIDTYAHASCLSHNGETVAVLGTGVDVVYPPQNQKLYAQIVARGLVLSEYPHGTQPDRSHFPRRNRIIAGLSQAIIVTEAPRRSGALITAHLANDYGRDVYALPHSLDNQNGQGCLDLINQGAQMILSEDHLLQTLGALPLLRTGGPASVTPVSISHTLPSQSQPVHEAMTLEPQLNQIWQALSLEPITLDNLVQQTQLDTGTLLSSLMQLELMGLITQLPGMQYQRCQ
jgi:DNA processing protein